MFLAPHRPKITVLLLLSLLVVVVTPAVVAENLQIGGVFAFVFKFSEQTTP
jgi:hypothetical protein